jgi:hypothetical protein
MMNPLDLYGKYMHSKITRDEQHLLERYSLDDPFMGDALEGIHLFHKEQNIPVTLRPISELRNTKIRRLRKIFPYAVAASAIIALGLYTYFTISTPEPIEEMNPRGQQLLALTDETKEIKSSDQSISGDKVEIEIPATESSQQQNPNTEMRSLISEDVVDHKYDVETFSEIGNTPSEPSTEENERKIAFSVEPGRAKKDLVISEMVMKRSAKSDNSSTIPENEAIMATQSLPSGFLDHFQASSNIKQSDIDNIDISSRQIIITFEIDSSGSPQKIRKKGNGHDILYIDASEILRTGPKWSAQGSNTVELKVRYPIKTKSGK